MIEKKKNFIQYDFPYEISKNSIDKLLELIKEFIKFVQDYVWKQHYYT